MGFISVEYAAGFFDGEGHITLEVSKNGGKPWWWRLTVGVGQNDRTPLDALCARWGGTVHGYKKPTGMHYVWRVHTAQAKRFLEDVRPCLIVKAEAVDIVLELQQAEIRVPGCKGLSELEINRRMDIKARLRVVTALRGRKVG